MQPVPPKAPTRLATRLIVGVAVLMVLHFVLSLFGLLDNGFGRLVSQIGLALMGIWLLGSYVTSVIHRYYNA